MPFYADFREDIPSPHKPKRVIFYREGMKVYGLLPYILQRRLKAQFFSNAFSWGNAIIAAGSAEANWTSVPYTAPPEAVSALLDWLLADKGFEVALASPEDWDDDIFSANVFRMPPRTWFPLGKEARAGFLRVAGGKVSRGEMRRLLALPAGRPEPHTEEE